MFDSGLTLTAMSRHGIGFRQMPSDMTFGKAGPGLFPDSSDLTMVLGVLNSRFYEHLLRSLNPGASVSLGAIGRLPEPPPIHKERIDPLVTAIIDTATDDLRADIRETEFVPQNASDRGSFTTWLAEQMKREITHERCV